MNENGYKGAPSAEDRNGGNRKRRKNHNGKFHANNGGNNNVNNNANNVNGANGGNVNNGGQKQQKPQHAPKPQPQQKSLQQKQQQQKQQQQKQQQKQQKNKNADKNADNRKDTYVYTLDGNLYINLTNKCSNGCDFCVRNERSSYYGNYLWLRHGDPMAEKVIAAIGSFGDLAKFKEVVFCGFGEPTYKVAEMCAVADYAHSQGLKTRLNTNGQGNLINKRDIVPELKGKIDLVNVSLNAPDSASYQKVCRSMFGEEGFSALLDFAKNCKRNGVNCRFSVVDCIGEEAVESCKRLADSVSVPLHVRKYITDS